MCACVCARVCVCVRACVLGMYCACMLVCEFVGTTGITAITATVVHSGVKDPHLLSLVSKLTGLLLQIEVGIPHTHTHTHTHTRTHTHTHTHAYPCTNAEGLFITDADKRLSPSLYFPFSHLFQILSDPSPPTHTHTHTHTRTRTRTYVPDLKNPHTSTCI